MKNLLARLLIAWKAIRHLGLSQVFWYTFYQIGLRSGYFQRNSPIQAYQGLTLDLRSPFRLPERSRIDALLPPGCPGRADLIAEANEIVNGQVRLFSAQPAALQFGSPEWKQHWTAYEGRPASAGVEDFKYIWEPARFGWAYPLGRAYLVSGDERYPATFWQHCESFLDQHPPNQGPNWSSAQEVALRLLAMLFAARVFENSPHTTFQRRARLVGAVAAHAARIPLTLSYARAQNNNHLISEALGLYAAGFALPEHPAAQKWSRLGWRCLNHALQGQIQPDGTYSQHSMNYHRLVLHAALQARLMGQAFPSTTQDRLAAATRWLLAQVDPGSGQAPNLGANDGAHILPLASGGFRDYRPAAQAAARAFLGQAAFAPGGWDELGLWLGQDLNTGSPLPTLPTSNSVHRLGRPQEWATLRAVQFKSRPSHADQLHVDLWWRGENIALDPGAYRYTAPPPWDNSLTHTLVHNTIMANHQDQMQKAGRFLWLDWAQARLLDTPGSPAETIAAQHDGYRRLGVTHHRILTHPAPGRWQVVDHLLPDHPQQIDRLRSPIYPYTIHWLLPDWPWELNGQALTLAFPGGGRVRLALSTSIPQHPRAQTGPASLVRAGQILAGPQSSSPVRGWFSPTYGMKVPALSFSLEINSPLPCAIISNWELEA